MDGERQKPTVVRPTVEQALTRLTSFADKLIQHQQMVEGDCTDLKPEDVAENWFWEGRRRYGLPLENPRKHSQ